MDAIEVGIDFFSNDKFCNFNQNAFHFLREYSASFAKNIWLSDGARAVLESLEWEGNIRQLRNFCERLSAVHPGGEVCADFVRSNYLSSYSYALTDES